MADLFELSVVLDDEGEVDDEFKQLARMDLESSEEARQKVDQDILDILLRAVKGEWQRVMLSTTMRLWFRTA